MLTKISYIEEESEIVQMNLNELFDIVLFNVGNVPISLGGILGVVLLLFGLFALYLLFRRRFIAYLEKREDVDAPVIRKVRRIFLLCLFLAGITGAVYSLGIDQLLYQTPYITIRLTTLLAALLLFQLARLVDWLSSHILLSNYYSKQEKSNNVNPTIDRRYQKKDIKTASQSLKYVVYVIAVLVIFQLLNVNYSPLEEVSDDQVKTRLSDIILGVLIILAARLAIWMVINLFLVNYYKRQRINIGSQYSINQLLQYFVYVIAILMALEVMGFSLTVLWGGAAALLVGVGLGLQQTFNDLISGIILLFERTVEVGDFVQIEGLIGIVKRIGLRTSVVETRENISVVVPNSKLIVDNVVNWSHYDNKARFQVDVGVAYGSDTQLVKDVLLEVAKSFDPILKYPAPFVRFSNFGDSALDFQLHFWSKNFSHIEDLKSDLRFEIDRRFREENIAIPFPQRDVWLRNGE
ncbi:MAG: mechanosensitive ion channel domain-containing protein [Bacteroidota bacterium]